MSIYLAFGGFKIETKIEAKKHVSGLKFLKLEKLLLFGPDFGVILEKSIRMEHSHVCAGLLIPRLFEMYNVRSENYGEPFNEVLSVALSHKCTGSMFECCYD